MKPRALITVAFAAALLAASSTFAGDDKVLVIKGKVIDDDSKPADGTEIRVKALDCKAPDKVAVTDSRGHYIVIGLVPGNYSVTAYDFFGSARSRAIVKANRRGWAKVDFDFALDSMVGDGANTIEGHEHSWSAS